MIPALRAEWRKLISVRSTYVIIGFSILIVLFAAGFIGGYRAAPSDLLSSKYLSGQMTSTISAIVALGSFVGLLLFGHEYRYSVIIYSLTSSNSRAKFLAAKIAVVTLFSVLFTAGMSALALLAVVVGVHLHQHSLGTQSVEYGALWWRCLFFGWGYSMFALIFIALIRNQIGAIIAFLILPGTVEGLLTLLLHNNAKYLPFTALSGVLSVDHHHQTAIIVSTHVAVLTSLGYIIGAWIITYILFLRRDAN